MNRKILGSFFLGMFWALSVQAQVDWIPANCVVQDWCLKSVTSCFIGFVSHPSGLYQAQAQYSIVRVAQVECHSYYGGVSQSTLTGPVEAATFTSEVESDESTARSEAFNLCERYRTDYVSAAPACKTSSEPRLGLFGV